MWRGRSDRIPRRSPADGLLGRRRVRVDLPDLFQFLLDRFELALDLIETDLDALRRRPEDGGPTEEDGEQQDADPREDHGGAEELLCVEHDPDHDGAEADHREDDPVRVLSDPPLHVAILARFRCLGCSLTRQAWRP